MAARQEHADIRGDIVRAMGPQWGRSKANRDQRIGVQPEKDGKATGKVLEAFTTIDQVHVGDYVTVFQVRLAGPRLVLMQPHVRCC